MSALTANNTFQKKNVEGILALPVDTGEIIYHNSIVGIGSDGLLKNITLALAPSILMVGIVADDSANLSPSATTGDGSLLNDRTSDVAGDKTVRLVWPKGRFLLTFTDTLSQDEVGKVAYAKNNFDCSISSADAVPVGTILSVFSSSQAWVDLNMFYRGDTVTVKKAVAGSSSTAVGAQVSLLNPFPERAILESFVFDIVTASSGGATMDIGVGLSGSVDTLMDGLTLNGAVTGLKTISLSGGTNGKACPQPVAIGDGVVGTASATTAGLVAVAEAKFRRWV